MNKREPLEWYQYNFSDGRSEIIPSTSINGKQWLYCDNPFYYGYPVCAWKYKFWYESNSAKNKKDNFLKK